MNTEKIINTNDFINQRIELMNDCFIEFHQFDTNYICQNFNEMFNLHPENRHKIISYEEEVLTNRWSKSYLKTPSINEVDIKNRTYMYSGLDDSQNNNELPSIFQPIYEYIKSIDSNYNQCTINWYQDENDMIPMHSDCQRCMIENGKIAIITLYPDCNEDNIRQMRIKSNDDNLRVNLNNGSILVFGPGCQNHYKHGISRSITSKSPRISLSFRQMI